MRRIIAVTLATFVLAGMMTLAQASTAAAATGSGGTTGYCYSAGGGAPTIPAGYTSTEAYGPNGDQSTWRHYPGKTAQQLADIGAYVLAVDKWPTCTGGPQPHAYLAPGNTWYPSWLLVFTHNDVIGWEWKLAAAGFLGAAGWACDNVIPLPAYVTAPLCIAAFAFIGNLVDQYFNAAANQVTWWWAWWFYGDCGRTSWSCSIAGSYYHFDPLGGLGYWVIPQEISGLNVLFAFPAFPVGLEVNPTP